MGIYGDSWKINMAAPEDEFWDMPDMHSHMYHTRLESARIWDISSFWLFSEGFAALLECKMAIENPNPDFFWTINYVFRCMVLRHQVDAASKKWTNPLWKLVQATNQPKPAVHGVEIWQVPAWLPTGQLCTFVLPSPEFERPGLTASRLSQFEHIYI